MEQRLRDCNALSIGLTCPLDSVPGEPLHWRCIVSIQRSEIIFLVRYGLSVWPSDSPNLVDRTSRHIRAEPALKWVQVASTQPTWELACRLKCYDESVRVSWSKSGRILLFPARTAFNNKLEPSCKPLTWTQGCHLLLVKPRTNPTGNTTTQTTTCITKWRSRKPSRFLDDVLIVVGSSPCVADIKDIMEVGCAATGPDDPLLI